MGHLIRRTLDRFSVLRAITSRFRPRATISSDSPSVTAILTEALAGWRLSWTDTRQGLSSSWLTMGCIRLERPVP
jgi:hypothetical protein